ncbi:hypothetical protein D3C81_1938550 [compost metagenome]
MSGKHDATPVARTDGGEQVGLGALLVVEKLALYALLSQVIPDESDELKIGVPTDGRKTDQFFQQDAAGRLTHRPAPRSWAQP